jgi:hypothetical protein
MRLEVSFDVAGNELGMVIVIERVGGDDNLENT